MSLQKNRFKKSVKKSLGIKIEIVQGKKSIGRAYLYLIKNDLHSRPYGLMEDVFVDAKYRGQGLGTLLITALVKEAKRRKCYKLIGTTRFANLGAQKLYQRLGFKKHGVEFRIDF